MEIKSFKINKLHDSLNFELKFENNTLILLGENGSCKTTIIKMLYYTLQWGKLSQYNFESIEICINNEISIIKRDDLILSSMDVDLSVLRRLPSQIRRNIEIMIDKNEGIDIQRLERLCSHYGYPFDMIYQELSFDGNLNLFSDKKNKKASIQKAMQKFKKEIEGIHVLYLPTYRRIEQELKVVLNGRIDEDDFRARRFIGGNDNAINYTELIEFGMRDVNSAIEETLTNLKESSRSNLNQLTLGYLGDIVDEKYQSTNSQEINSIEESTINDIMNRVDESILSEESKKRLSDTLHSIKDSGIKSDHDKVVCHYFLKLFESHKELVKKEATIRDFADVCSQYLENKEIIYDSPNFRFIIKSKYDEHEISLQQLSSGEKQIVSLFSHLYLSKKQNYIVLIDEPELSLSVKWQKLFLQDVRKGTFCKGLIAVTHSPFIFDNELDMYAHGIEEFKN